MAENPDKTFAGNEARDRLRFFSIGKVLGMVMLIAPAIVLVNSVINTNLNFINRFTVRFLF